MTSVIAPAILSETEDQYRDNIDKIKSFADRIHIDISDGEFAPVFLLDSSRLWWPKEWTVDIHAMVMHPTEYVDRLIALRPNMIIFHAETDVNLMPIMEKIKKAGIKAGVALLKPTVPATIIDIIKAADHVLVFSGDLGYYGGKASLMQLEKVRLIKNINPDVEIGWDGGVSIDNAFTLAQGGVNVLNTGGAINRAEDPDGVYATLVREINKQGVI
jgi:ribulose-phosphate 3-epimerase